MRGTIIHYNGSEGKGLIATPECQYPFDITLWRSDVAPAINQTVELTVTDGLLTGVSLVPASALLNEKAGQVGQQLGKLADGLRSRLGEGSAQSAGSGLHRLGKPLLAAQVVFAISALFLPFLKTDLTYGAGKSYSLAGLSDLSEKMGTSIGGASLPWLAILSVLLPLFWRNRWAWLALLLPLLATLMPAFDFYRAIRSAGKQVEAMGGSGFASAMVDQLADMLSIGFGAWLCLLASLVLAGLAVKRALLSAPTGDA